jgi:mRNA interferase MazF
VAGQNSPRQGWIYKIDPYRVSLKCSRGHKHIYNLISPGEVECQTTSCSSIINSSRVLRGTHPYIIWTSEQFLSESNYIQTFTAIPLTSQTTSVGLPTTYPITNTARNGLDKKSYALVHQICIVDGNCFKDESGNWFSRCGQLDAKDKTEIQERLKYYLNFDSILSEDWFKKNATPEVIKKLFGYLSDSKKNETIEDLLENIE